MYLLSSAGASVAPWLPAAGAALGLYLYYPLYQRTKSAGIALNIATFVLWTLLDSIVVGSTLFEDSGGNWQLPLAHAVGSALVAYAIHRTGTWTFGFREGLAAFFVSLSILVWMSVSAESAIIVSATGAVIAGIPQFFDWWKEPTSAPLDISFGMLLANGLGLTTLALGASFSYEEHFYAAAGTLIATAYALAAASRWFRQPAAQPAE